LNNIGADVSTCNITAEAAPAAAVVIMAACKAMRPLRRMMADDAAPRLTVTWTYQEPSAVVLKSRPNNMGRMAAVISGGMNTASWKG
jgi:hypothetical protein